MGFCFDLKFVTYICPGCTCMDPPTCQARPQPDVLSFPHLQVLSHLCSCLPVISLFPSSVLLCVLLKTSTCPGMEDSGVAP